MSAGGVWQAKANQEQPVKTEQKAIENKGNSPMYVGGVMIPPGEIKVVEVPLTRKTMPAPAAAPPGPDMAKLVAELLDLSIPDIVKQLPELTNEALDLTQQAEDAGKTRKGVLSAIHAERIRRANARIEEQERAKHEQALTEARDALLRARVAETNLPPTATQEERQAAETAVEEAQAKVDALENPEG